MIRMLLRRSWTALLTSAILGSLFGTSVQAKEDGNELARRTTWSIPTESQIQVQLDEYLARVKAPSEQADQARAVWQQGRQVTDPDVLGRVVAALAVVQPLAKQLIVACHLERGAGPLPALPQSTEPDLDRWARNNLSLYLARWLVQQELYDEAIELLAGLEPSDVVDPATLLFHQAVCAHQLLDKEGFEKAAGRLLENERLLPRRYRSLAQLMNSDLGPVEKDSLDEIQRLMGDVRRRLTLGRAGKRVRDEEDEVIAKLDKLIKKAEDQQKQQQQAAGAGAGAQAPAKPAQDSTAPPGGGQGNVEAKKLSNKESWGNLPPKARQESLQQISKDLPAHYREVIEEYFRKLARDGDRE